MGVLQECGMKVLETVSWIVMLCFIEDAKSVSTDNATDGFEMCVERLTEKLSQYLREE